ncbi:vWA domain-containing protein [Floccifex sp.]|uniref:vWA domain-containing protein n=1 Tax=Floccifex sp. TaxID=2815810 RepID=UPI002A75E790|nr:VWA-like domain-containing protein [Floccifex sp.]MDD7281126.1 VWA-like domain-containing protein [Erysipelotrichaceae bacterium]MDY2957791.1 VWA-like domain-containing protein [Floccifex sp.]
MKHVQTQTEWEISVSYEIFSFIKSELYLDMPFMALPLNTLNPYPKENIMTFQTDGEIIYFSCEQLMRLFQRNPLYLNRAYLHSVLHCVFNHLWIKQNRNQDLWNLACDICVEYTIDHMEKKSVKRILSYLRKKTYETLESEYGLSASNIYMFLLNQDNLMALQQEFVCDDHALWPKNAEEAMQPRNQMLQKQWSQISSQSKLSQEQGDEQGQGEQLYSSLVKASKSQRSYKEFLRKFAIQKEEVHLDEDEFDLSYYTYGLSIYKNMPLIEPLETKEMRKIQEFVIVLDTSYSTSGTLVENFLKETYTILSQSNSFFSKSKIHIIQCDDRIQNYKLISNQKEMEDYLSNFEIKGGNGTDFRPAFEYINQLIENGKCKELSGMIYFTDGQGIYPKKRPDYRCAFLFLDDFDETKVPSWAMRLKVDYMELGEQHEYQTSKR